MYNLKQKLFDLTIYFLEICLLTNARRVASVKSMVYSNLYSLDRESFLSVLENYPLMRRTMESIAAERLNKIGKNPAIVSNREDLKEDLTLVKEIVSSVATPDLTSSGHNSETEDNQTHLNFKKFLNFSKLKISNRYKLNDESHQIKEIDSNLDKLKQPIFKRPKLSIQMPAISSNSLKLLRSPKPKHFDFKNTLEKNQTSDNNDHQPNNNNNNLLNNDVNKTNLNLLNTNFVSLSNLDIKQEDKL